MEVNFFLPGLRRNYPINVTFIRLLQDHPEFFREGVKIAACYGEFPPSLWAGGRNSRPDMCDEKFIYAEHGTDGRMYRSAGSSW